MESLEPTQQIMIVYVLTFTWRIWQNSSISDFLVSGIWYAVLQLHVRFDLLVSGQFIPKMTRYV